ncbi:MAG: thiamine-phosphate kinase, partial [Deltaproteobacteria bacterium]
MNPRDELARVEALKQAFDRPRPDVLVGIGDDAAVLTACTGDLVLSVDVQVEDVHFRRGWLSMSDLGWRAVNAALSDLAAMGAEARGVLLSLVLPQNFDDDDLDELVRGAAIACDAAGTSVVGGNLARGSELSVTTTVIGDAKGPRITRAGAAPGDGVFVTGVVGASALAVAAFEAERGDEAVFAPFIARFRRPEARLALGRQLAGQATAAADISDGLIADLGQVCRPSGVGARIDSHLVPTLPG